MKGDVSPVVRLYGTATVYETIGNIQLSPSDGNVKIKNKKLTFLTVFNQQAIYNVTGKYEKRETKSV